MLWIALPLVCLLAAEPVRALASFRYPAPPESLAITHYFVHFESLDVDLDSFYNFLISTKRVDDDLKQGFLGQDANDTVLYLWFNSYRPCVDGVETVATPQILNEDDETEFVLNDKMEFWRRNDQEKILVLENLPFTKKQSVKSVKYSSSCAYVATLDLSNGQGWVQQSGIQDVLATIAVFRSGSKDTGLPPLELELWLKKHEPNVTDQIFKLASIDVSGYLESAVKNCRSTSTKFRSQTCSKAQLNLTDSETAVSMSISEIVTFKFNPSVAIPLIVAGILLSIGYIVAVVDMFVMSQMGRSCWTNAKYLLGNIVYLTFGGAIIYVLLCLSCLLFMLSFVGYPTGLQVLKISTYWLCPFGRTLSIDSKPASADFLGKCKEFTREVAWFTFAGTWLCGLHLFCAFVCSGLGLIPVAEVHLERGLQVLNPLPAQIELKDLHLNDIYEEVSVNSRNAKDHDSFTEQRQMPRRKSSGSDGKKHERSASMYAF
jgi:uncharacterized membrane protein YccF (DUF307 family)